MTTYLKQGLILGVIAGATALVVSKYSGVQL